MFHYSKMTSTYNKFISVQPQLVYTYKCTWYKYDTDKSKSEAINALS